MLTKKDACDYQKVKNAVLRKYEINKETYRQHFRDCAVRQIGDTIIMEQYLKMVNPELCSWIIEHSPTSTDQAVTLAEAYTVGDLSMPWYSCEPDWFGDGYGSGSKPQVFRSSTQS
uniref:SCAN box domain-containing protein n=1 Tax=Pygocentrus nattereri TaxID=42514 RepID=A0AAR2JZZ1_PYGNA